MLCPFLQRQQIESKIWLREPRGQQRTWASGDPGAFLAARRFPTGGASPVAPPAPALVAQAPQLHPCPSAGLTSEGLRGEAPPDAGSPTAGAGSWSSCAGQSCRGWHVGGSSGGVPHSLSPGAGKLCSLAGLGSCTASHWAGGAAPHPRGPWGPPGKGCLALRLVPAQLGCHWLSPEARSGCQASRASSPPSRSPGHHPPLESWPPALGWGSCCEAAGGGVGWVGCSPSLASHGCRVPRETA